MKDPFKYHNMVHDSNFQNVKSISHWKRRHAASAIKMS
jgi:hypothetical protein